MSCSATQTCFRMRENLHARLVRSSCLSLRVPRQATWEVLWALHVARPQAWAPIRLEWEVEVTRQLPVLPVENIVASAAKTSPDLATTKRISSTLRTIPTPRDRVLPLRIPSKLQTRRAQLLRLRKMRTRRNPKSRRKTRKRRRRLLTLTTQNQTIVTMMTLTSRTLTVTKTRTIQMTARKRSVRLSEPNAARSNLEQHRRPIASLLLARHNLLHQFSPQPYKLHLKSRRLQLSQM